MPPFYYGRSYDKIEYNYTLYHIIPFNYFIRWTKWVNWIWSRFRGRKSWIDKKLDERNNYWFDYYAEERKKNIDEYWQLKDRIRKLEQQ